MKTGRPNSETANDGNTSRHTYTYLCAAATELTGNTSTMVKRMLLLCFRGVRNQRSSSAVADC